MKQYTWLPNGKIVLNEGYFLQDVLIDLEEEMDDAAMEENWTQYQYAMDAYSSLGKEA